MWSLENETKKIQFNEEKQKLKDKEEELNKINEDLSKIRFTAIISTIAAFLTHVLGACLGIPLVILCGLGFFLPLIFSTPKFFKLLDKEDACKKEIQSTKELIEKHEKELKKEETRNISQEQTTAQIKINNRFTTNTKRR